ncbi:MAG: HEAT repeat domain-containing protein, partial [Methanomicrobium sp.]|nr:HEAT repeat domain-containing protein [Methanomicrobium sp.]
MPDDINELISSLDSSDKKERNEAKKKLKGAGIAGSVPLLKALNSNSEQVRIAAAEILGTYSKDNLDTFLNLLKTGNKNVKDGAARTIAQIAKGGVPVYEFLSAMINDENYKSREGAAIALGYTGRNDKNTINMLLFLLRDQNKDVREEAVKSLDAIKWKSSNQTENAYYFLIKEDWNSLGRLGAYSVPALSFGIEVSDFNIKNEIAAVLARINNDSANPLLILLLNDSNSSVRLSAVAAIAEKRDNSLFPLLVQSMYDSDPNVRVEASWSLEKAGWKPQKFSEKTRSLMLRGNYKEVESMGDKAIPSLIEFLGDDIHQRRESAYKILYSFGKPGIDAIKKASNDSDTSIKNGAHEALAYIREEEVKKEEDETEAILNGSKVSFELNSFEYWEEKLIKAGFGIEITQAISKALSSEDSIVRIVAIDNLKKFGKNSSD